MQVGHQMDYDNLLSQMDDYALKEDQSSSEEELSSISGSQDSKGNMKKTEKSFISEYSSDSSDSLNNERQPQEMIHKQMNAYYKK